MAAVRTMNWDAVAAAAPQDRQASTVRDGSGDLWDGPAIPSHCAHWKSPPLPTGILGKGYRNYAGATFGRLTVIRYHGKSGVSTPVPTWLVRCSCGDYELRRTKSMQTIQRRARTPTTKLRRKAEAVMLDRIAAGERR